MMSLKNAIIGLQGDKHRVWVQRRNLNSVNFHLIENLDDVSQKVEEHPSFNNISIHCKKRIK